MNLIFCLECLYLLKKWFGSEMVDKVLGVNYNCMKKERSFYVQ